MKKVMSPHEAEVSMLLQIMAVLVNRLDGEVFISRAELEAFYEVPVLSRIISPEYFRLSLGDEDLMGETEVIDLPEEPSQP